MRPEDQSLARDLSKPNNFYIEYMVASGNAMLLLHSSRESDEEQCFLFSGSFTGLRGKDGMRNQFDLVLKFALDSLSPKRRRGLFPAHQPPCAPILSDEIQVLCCINLGELTEV